MTRRRPTFAAAFLPALALGCATVASDPDAPLREKAGLAPTVGSPAAIHVLPKTALGYVDWMAALKNGKINPRWSLGEQPPAENLLDLNIVFRTSAAYPVPDVVFPHLPHTMWLDCNACHPAIFRMRQGATPITMERIIRGEFCGRCHGTVAFPIVDCFRCHSREKGK